MNGFLKSIAKSLGLHKDDRNTETCVVQQRFIPHSFFEICLDKCLQDYQVRIIEMMNQLSTGEVKSLKATVNKLDFSVSTLHHLHEVLNELGYTGIVTLFSGKHAKACKVILANSTFDPSFTRTSPDVITTLRDLKVDKYCEMPQEIFARVFQASMDAIITGKSINKDLKAIRDSVDEPYKELITLYSDTIRGDFTHDIQELHAAQYEGVKYWEYSGPDDGNNRPACVKLLEIRYFTDAQKIKAEAKYAQERLFGCRHTFVQITKEDYLEEKRRLKSERTALE